MTSREKLQRVERLRRTLPHMSASAFAAVLKEFWDDPIEPLHRNTIRKARDEMMMEATPYGPILNNLRLDRKGGGTSTINIADPFAMLYTLVKQCHGFSSLLQYALRRHPPSYDAQWRVLVYSDEVIPGNQLSLHNLRKVWVLYWSFLEFGAAVLSMEDAWLCLAVVESDHVKDIEGGMAQVFGAVLKHMFASGHGDHTLTHSGVLLDFPDMSSTRLFARLEMILQDGGAHKLVFMVKGDAGTKFCMGCRTLYTESSDIVDGDTNDALLTCSQLFESDMDFATDAEVRGTVARLALYARTHPARTTRDKELLGLREQACGFNHNPHNMLLEPALDDVVNPVSQFAHDPMHTFFVHGVWNACMYLMLMALVHDGVENPTNQFMTYIVLWTLPRRLGSNISTLADVFSKARWASAKKAK